jgi:CheY-like chemotaxis protein
MNHKLISALIIDDNDTNRGNLTQDLRGSKYFQEVKATGGKRFANVLESAKTLIINEPYFDLTILDIMMSGAVDEYDVTQAKKFLCKQYPLSPELLTDIFKEEIGVDAIGGILLWERLKENGLTSHAGRLIIASQSGFKFLQKYAELNDGICLVRVGHRHIIEAAESEAIAIIEKSSHGG